VDYQSINKTSCYFQKANTRPSLHIPTQGIHTEKAIKRHETRWLKKTGNKMAEKGRKHNRKLVPPKTTMK
jgi:hypothetical protein